MPNRPARWLALITVSAAAAACGGKDGTSPPPPPPVPSAIALVSGNSQTGTAGQVLPQPLVVRVTSNAGGGVGGVSVSWAVTAGGGNVSSGSTPTDAQGQAQVTWTAGPAAGSNNNVATASLGGVTGSPVTFTASASAGPAAQLVLVSGDNQTGRVDSVLPNPLVVLVRDAHANPISGATVTWSFTGGGGTVNPTSVTDTAGHASATPVLGKTAGSGKDTVTATIAGLTGTLVTFTANARPGPAAQLALAGGDNQSAPAGTTLPVAHSVRASDAFGNTVSGVAVDWAVTSGGGSISPPQSATDTSGVATATRTLGPTAGTQTTTATSNGLTGSPVGFTATGSPNGTISGTITVASGFLSPPLLSQRSQSAGLQNNSMPGLALSPPARTKAIRSRSMATGLSTVRRVPRRPQYVPGEVVTYRSSALAVPSVGSAALRSATTARTLGATIRARLRESVAANAFEVAGVIPTILTARIRVADTTRVQDVMSLLRSDPTVLAVERNGLVYSDDYGVQNGKNQPVSSTRITAAILPNDPVYPLQAWHYGAIDLPSAWSITTGSASVLVAVVDQGIRFDHPGVAGNLTNDGYDFVSDLAVPACGGGFVSNAGDGTGYDPDPTIPAAYEMDPINNCATGLSSSGAHGLHVAGTIGAVGNDGSGVTGVNWTVRLRPVRVLGTTGAGTDADVINGILYAAGLPVDTGAGGPPIQASSAARIINLSLGSAGGSMAESLAVVSAKNAGVFLIAAAGNDGLTSPAYPAAFPEVLSVSAIGPDFNLASYSNYAGPNGVAAPGGDLVDGDGSFGVMSTAWNFQTNTAIYDGSVWNGTSMAAPHVAGIAALLLAQNLSLTGDQLRARLRNFAFDLGVAGPDNLYGAGIVNARNSLTQSFSPTRNSYARLYNATTGALVQTAPVAGNGSYAFSGLADGSYQVFAGEDENGDQTIGVPDPGQIARRWGAFGGTSTPTTVTVAGAGTYPAPFSIALPIEVEPNNTTANADPLPVGGYVVGVISDPSTDLDAFRVLIPQTGQYTFETSGYIGACGFALDEDTVLGLYDVNGTLITSNDDINFAGLNLCSRITATLSAGTYYIAVTGYRGGNYVLQGRSGS